jgi:hypothetical protein
MAKLTLWKQILSEFSGRRIYASYAVEDGMVIVKTARGHKAAQGGGPNAIWLAGRLLRELAEEGKA